MKEKRIVRERSKTMCELGYCVYDEPYLMDGVISIPTCEECPHWVPTSGQEWKTIMEDRP